MTIEEKLAKPTRVFQPGSSSSPAADSNEPSPLSVKTVPSLIRVNVSVAGSYRSVGWSVTAASRPSGRMAALPPSTGTVNAASCRSSPSSWSGGTSV